MSTPSPITPAVLTRRLSSMLREERSATLLAAMLTLVVTLFLLVGVAERMAIPWWHSERRNRLVRG